MTELPPELLDRYSAPTPRYTSYPTVMHWGKAPAEAQWVDDLGATLGAAIGGSHFSLT